MTGLSVDAQRNYDEVLAAIRRSCRRVGRDPSRVKVVAVTKGFGVGTLLEAPEVGITDIGENRVQEIVEKHNTLHRASLRGKTSLNWHFIGHLQRNKVKYLVNFVDLIHSVDSLRLAREIDKRANQAQRRIPVLLQVNVADEDSKFGVTPDRVLELATAAGSLSWLEVRGLMTVAPFAESPEDVRPIFRRLRQLADELAEADLPGVSMVELSMGMSGDYEVAVEEGATIVRVGSAIFGPRQY